MGKLTVTGMVMSASPIGDYDRRVVLLTKERGKISAFARGARKPNSPLIAGTNPFAFGQFEVFEGRSSYTISQLSIQQYFRELAEDVEAAYYGFYFMEFADYYAQEYVDESDMLALVYQSFRALSKKTISYPLIRRIFEIRSMYINGEFPDVQTLAEKADRQYNSDTLYTLHFIETTPIQKLFTFRVSDIVYDELAGIAEGHIRRYIDRKFRSLEILNSIV